LPRLQKLVEQYNNRSDVLFLSLNMDENPGLVEPFMREHKLTLTALPAYSYVTQTLKVNGIPQNWIVGADGVIRLKGAGYDSTEKWEQGMKEPSKSAGRRNGLWHHQLRRQTRRARPLTRAIRRLVWHTTSSESWTVHTGNSIRSTNCKGAVRQADAVAEQTGDAFLASQPCSAIPGPQFPTSPFFRSKSSLNGGKSGSGQLSRWESAGHVTPFPQPP
jgi:hypothetical protein